MIKIAFVIDTIESPTAGTEKQLLMLIKHLDREKFQPFLCVLRLSKWLENEFHDCELLHIDVASFGNLRYWKNILNFVFFLRKKRVNIVQTYFADGNKVGVFAGKLAGIKKIISTRRNQGYWHTNYEVAILHILNRWVNFFLANSENTRQWTVKTEGIAPQRIKVIYNSLENERFYRASEDRRLAFREHLDFPPNAIIVGIIANLRPVKAIDVFIKAAKIVSGKSLKTYFIVVGDGPERDFLKTMCHEMELGASIRFLGKRQDIPEILSCIDIGVLSSSSESFSNAIVEYMAAGLAVVCTDVGGAREAVEDGVNGYVVAAGDYRGMADQLNTIIDENLYTSLGQLGRVKAEQLFSHKEIVNRYQRLYGQMI